MEEVPGAENLLPSSWTLFAIAMLVVICRMASRRMTLGSFRKYQTDDYLMIIASVSNTKPAR